MDRETANTFVQRIRQHRAAEKLIWAEIREHPEYGQHEDQAISEAVEAFEAADEAVREAVSALDSFDMVPDPNDPDGIDFIHKGELAERQKRTN